MEIKLSGDKNVTSAQPYARFVMAIIAAHTLGYLFAGGIAYQVITKNLWESPDSLLAAYLRTPGQAELWKYAMIWQVPAQLIRGLFIALVLLPLRYPLKEWSASKKAVFFGSLLFILTHLSSAAPSPANIEGLVYMRPEFIRLGFFKMQPEMIFYGIIAGLMFSKFAYKKEKTVKEK